MKTTQCTYPTHRHNDFVATCRLWTTMDDQWQSSRIEKTLKKKLYNNSNVVISQDVCANILMEEIFAKLVFTEFFFVVLPQILEDKF